MPPMAAVDLTGAQQCQRFDDCGAERLRNRQRFAGDVPLARDLKSAVAGSVRTLGIRYIACLRSGIRCSGTSICIY